MEKHKTKNRIPVVVAVIEGLFAIAAAVLSLILGSQLQQIQNQTQQVNVNVINSLGEQANSLDLSDSSNIEYVTDELIQAYLTEVDKNKQMEDSQNASSLEMQNLQNEIDALEQSNDTLVGQNKTLSQSNDELKKQIDDLKGFILEKYTISDVDKLIEEGFVKQTATVRLDSLEWLDGENCEQVSSVKDLYGTTHSISYKMHASYTGTSWAKFKLDGKYDTFSANIVTSQDTARDANISVEIYVDNVIMGRVDDIVRDENARPINISVNGGNVLLIKAIGMASKRDNICFITDTEISALE